MEIKKYHGMFMDITVPDVTTTIETPINEDGAILTGGDNEIRSAMSIPTMKGLEIFVGNETGSHNSGRVKVISTKENNNNKSFIDKNKKYYYEVHYNKKVIFKGGELSKITNKQKLEIEDFYMRNKVEIQACRDDKLNEEIYINRILERERKLK